jgi:hypothetical protein
VTVVGPPVGEEIGGATPPVVSNGGRAGGATIGPDGMPGGSAPGLRDRLGVGDGPGRLLLGVRGTGSGMPPTGATVLGPPVGTMDEAPGVRGIGGLMCFSRRRPPF